VSVNNGGLRKIRELTTLVAKLKISSHDMPPQVWKRAYLYQVEGIQFYHE